MGINRRDLLRFAAGSGVGVAFTPVPWKLLDDSAIWTQNWRLTPKLPRGEVTTRFSTCTLCPAGCGVKAQCVGGVPFSLAGVASHPNSKGALCAAGVGGHHLAYRQDRVRGVLYHGKPSKLARAMHALRSAQARPAILDLRPERAVSEAYRTFATQVNGSYFTPRPEAMGGFGVDLENTKTLLSFGAPVLDGWAAPGRVWAARSGFRLIQADAVGSRTAMLADAWLPVCPGSEAALALAIGHVMLRDGLTHKDASRAADFAAYESLTARFTPEFASGITGLSPERIVATAREFASGAPALAVGGAALGEAERVAIAALNSLAGGAGRHEFAAPGSHIEDAADGSIAALVIDCTNTTEQVAWKVIKKKLAAGAVVVALAAFRKGVAKHADYVVPAPVYLEALDEAPAFGIAPALLPKPAEALDSAEFLARVAETFGTPPPGSTEEMLKQKAAALLTAKRGSVFSYASGETKPMTEFAKADDLWTALTEGGCWVGDESSQPPPVGFHLLGTRQDGAERLRQAGERRLKRNGDFPLAAVSRSEQRTGDAALAPMMTKLYQESQLRPEPDAVILHPQTAAKCGVEDGCTAVVEAPGGSAKGRVRVSAVAVPGVVELCTSEAWPAAPARIRRA